jgi:tripartite ATP-independent transporter DctM subunit
MIAASLGFAASLALIFFRMPIAIAMAITGFVGFGILLGWKQSAIMLALTIRDSSMSYSLAVVPLFILMGNLIAGTGVSRELYRAAQLWLSRRRGGLAQATILSCAGFGMVCGSTVATVITMGKVALPSMREYRYDDQLSTASIAVGATLGVVVPPSVLLVIYGILTETHIGKLYAAALVPAATAIGAYMLVIWWVVRKNPSMAPEATRTTWSEKLNGLVLVWPVLVLFVIVLGGIYTGFFTATEAAGIGAFGAFLLALARGRLTWESLHEILLDSAESTTIIFILLVGGSIFTEFLNYTGAHSGLLALIQDSGLSPVAVIFLICGIYFVLGALMDELSMVLLTVPLFLPIIVAIGYDPVWFGIIVITMCTLGMIVPPIGINLFVVHSLAPEVPILKIVRGVVPFIVVDVVRVSILILLPPLSLFVPSLFFD